MMPLLDLPDGLADDLTGHLTGAGELVELKRVGHAQGPASESITRWLGQLQQGHPLGHVRLGAARLGRDPPLTPAEAGQPGHGRGLGQRVQPLPVPVLGDHRGHRRGPGQVVAHQDRHGSQPSLPRGLVPPVAHHDHVRDAWQGVPVAASRRLRSLRMRGRAEHDKRLKEALRGDGGRQFSQVAQARPRVERMRRQPGERHHRDSGGISDCGHYPASLSASRPAMRSNSR